MCIPCPLKYRKYKKSWSVSGHPLDICSRYGEITVYNSLVESGHVGNKTRLGSEGKVPDGEYTLRIGAQLGPGRYMKHGYPDLTSD